MVFPVSDQTVVVVARARWELLVCLVEKARGETLEKMVKEAQRGRRATSD